MVYPQDARDNEFVRRTLEGDTAAFGELVEAYQTPVFRVASRIVGDKDEAADVTQSTFLKAFEQLRRFNPRYRFFTWLYTIAVRTAINAARKRSGEAIRPEGFDVAAPDEDHAERNDERRFVRRAIGELPPDLRAPLVLFHYDDCSYSEIAELVGTTETRVRSRIFEARKRLRLLLQRNGYAT